MIALLIANSLALASLLIMLASGLALIYGLRDVINFGHGAIYMLGAYLAFSLTQYTGNLMIAILMGLPLAVVFGLFLERIFIARLYGRDHLYQVLLTYGLILVLDESRSLIWGNDVHGVPVPPLFDWSIPLTNTLSYPVYRLLISAICLAIAGGMYLLIQKTRLGMMIRAGAANREMTQALGIDIGLVHGFVFALGVVLAALSGMVAAPVSSVFPGMGGQILIVTFVVVVIGGIGSIKGALIGALLIGLVDTFGKVLVPQIAGMAVYLLMGLVLLLRPAGLFGRP